MLVNKEVKCDACDGTGKEKCRGCGGSGKIFIPITNEEQPCPTCSNGFLPCSSCSGTGKKTISVEAPDPKPEPKPQPKPQPVQQEKPQQPEQNANSPEQVMYSIAFWISTVIAIFIWISSGSFWAGVISWFVVCAICGAVFDKLNL